MLLFGERDLEDISKISKKTLSSSVQLGKRKLLDDRVVDLQKIIDKMVSVDKIVNEFHTLDMKMKREIDEMIEQLGQQVLSLKMTPESIHNNSQLDILVGQVRKQTSQTQVKENMNFTNYELLLQEMQRVHNEMEKGLGQYCVHQASSMITSEPGTSKSTVGIQTDNFKIEEELCETTRENYSSELRDNKFILELVLLDMKIKNEMATPIVPLSRNMTTHLYSEPTIPDYEANTETYYNG